METYNSKYIKTWSEYLKENPDLTENDKEAMKPRIDALEKTLFNYVIELLL